MNPIWTEVFGPDGHSLVTDFTLARVDPLGTAWVSLDDGTYWRTDNIQADPPEWRQVESLERKPYTD